MKRFAQAAGLAVLGLMTVAFQNCSKFKTQDYNSDTSFSSVSDLISTPSPTSSAPPAIAAGRKGVCNGKMLNLSYDGMVSEFNDMKTAGVSWVRVDFRWPDLEPARGTFNTARHDTFARAAQATGMNVVAILDYSPAWASGRTDSIMYPPTNPDDYGRYAGYVAARYSKMGIHVYEIWNEQNLASVFWLPGANPAVYTQMLKSAYVAIKAADPQSIVMTGGLSPAPADGYNMTPMDFMRGVYANGGKDYFDAVGYHPYTYPGTPKSTNGSAYWWLDMLNMRILMGQNGDSAKKIWMTEYGAPTRGGSNAVSEEIQATMIADAFAVHATYDWAGPLIIYEYRDSGTDPTNNEDNFGLIRFDGSRKPSWTAFRDASN